MFKNVWNWLVRSEPSVDTIVAPLNKIVSDLDRHHNDMLSRADKHMANAKLAEVKAVARTQEAAEAERTRDRLASLFGV